MAICGRRRAGGPARAGFFEVASTVTVYPDEPHSRRTCPLDRPEMRALEARLKEP